MDSHRNNPRITEDVTLRTASDCQQRLSIMVADGEVSFPTDLDDAERQSLAAAVRKRRRTTLIEFLARQIAVDIHRLPVGCPERDSSC
jgi:hypothetical protein